MSTKLITIIAVVVVVVGLGALIGFSAQPSPGSGAAKADDTNSTSTADNYQTSTSTSSMHATLHTNKGDIVIEFLPDLAPNAVANFQKLAGTGFYDGTKFHRVIKGFMIQGGDPLSKDDSQSAMWGTGGPGYKFADEITPDSHNTEGMVAMANSGPNTNGSQFFINTVDNAYLDGKYVVFGRVTSGMDVVHAIENTPTNSNDRPTSPMVIEKVTVN